PIFDICSIFQRITFETVATVTSDQTLYNNSSFFSIHRYITG
ncbi:hypothetical protein E2986_11573, partial [Frieseomelitta varia]